MPAARERPHDVPTSSRVFTRARHRTSIDVDELVVRAADLLDEIEGGRATCSFTTALFPSSGPETIVWSLLLQPANAAAAASVMSKAVRVIDFANCGVAIHRQGHVLAHCRSGT